MEDRRLPDCVLLDDQALKGLVVWRLDCFRVY